VYYLGGSVERFLYMSKRFSLTVPDTVFEQLEALAKSQGRTTANLAAYLVEVGVRNADPLPTEKGKNISGEHDRRTA
jgi:rRNA-processing protein FCF1